MAAFQWGLFEADLNPAAGTDQKDTRPVLVVSSEEFNQAMPCVTVLPLTTTRRGLYPAEAFLPAGAAGLPLDAIAMAHQARTISRARLGRLLGRVDDTSLRTQVRAALREHLDL
jgi:mRNA interferase MazF